MDVSVDENMLVPAMFFAPIGEKHKVLIFNTGMPPLKVVLHYCTYHKNRKYKIVYDDEYLIQARLALRDSPGSNKQKYPFRMMTWHSLKPPTLAQISEIYPKYDILFRAFYSRVNSESITTQVLGRNIDRAQAIELLMNCDLDDYKLPDVFVGRFFFGHRLIPANFIRFVYNKKDDFVNMVTPQWHDEESIFTDPCIFCALVTNTNRYECQMKIFGEFRKIYALFSKDKEHVQDVQSYENATKKYSGIVLDSGHLFTYTGETSEMTELRIAQLAKNAFRLFRDRHLKLTCEVVNDHIAIVLFSLRNLPTHSISEETLFKIHNLIQNTPLRITHTLQLEIYRNFTRFLTWFSEDHSVTQREFNMLEEFCVSKGISMACLRPN